MGPGGTWKGRSRCRIVRTEVRATRSLSAPFQRLEDQMARWSDTIVLDSSRLTINGALKGARNSTMLQILGNPRGRYSSECQPPENRRLRNLIVVRNVGPFRVQGIRPAVDTLETILADVKAAEPDIYGRLGHVTSPRRPGGRGKLGPAEAP